MTKTDEYYAKEFSLELLEEIGIDNLRKVVKRNFEETNINICHTHDFCDANQIMLDVIGYNDNDWDNDSNWDEFMIKMTKIWDVAKENNFYI